jgi:hypothetical protein
MKRHKWRKGGKGWWECINCGITKEKHFGMPPIYFMDKIRDGVYKAPPCNHQNQER